MTPENILSAAAWIAFCAFLVSGNETVLKCNVSQDSSGWTYRISDDAKKLTGLCKFQWINTTGHVIANEKHPAGPELNTLKSSRCLGNLTLKATCKENVHAAEYIANCTAICSKLAPLHEDTVWTSLVSGQQTVLKCNVSQDSSGWTYRISDEDKKLTDLCKVQWINATDMFSNKNKQAGPDFYTLKDPRCLGDLIFKATCKENGHDVEYIANCTDICSKLAPLHEETGGLTPLWIVLGIVAVTVAVCVGFLLRKKKKEATVIVELDN